MAYSTEKLLFINNSPILLSPLEKLCKQPTPLGNYLLLDPPPHGITVALRGEGKGGRMRDIFWNYAFSFIHFARK